jgi:LPXTG-motif cell wall-anchored protein
VNLGTLKPKQSVTFTIICEVKVAAEPGTKIKNTATVEVNEEELTLDNNTDDCDISVKGAAASLSIRKVVVDTSDTSAFTFIVKYSNGNPVDLSAGEITIAKIDGEGDYDPTDLENGKFTLTHDATVKIDGLAPGGYQVTEEALGYTIVYTVDGSAESGLSWDTATANTGRISPNETCALVFTNSSGYDVFPKTGGIGEKILYGLGAATIAAFAAGTVIYLRRRRRRNLITPE